ncbi:tRNA lysidine(34) synthetase TilS [Desertivirga xinjiangensis]|uniref:tRNA lysidine(34) synthetase TilS n=1 Tax=Desertivirga xinjiangensis TaxID=539206 RepID=UPI00210E7993|nr:tRNA lysidine(34) synthetase TilS [Pedobacter xinjiangensis]
MLPTSRFLSFVAQQKLFNPTDKVLLTVSGGRDSVLLCHLFNAARLDFGIAHCNFGLRSEESDADELFTKDLADSFKVPFYSVRFDTSDYAQSRSISTQMAARELRYNWFEEIRQTYGYQYIALAHHASDTTETVLLNLTRGTGIAGLHGILPKRDFLIRPLLFLSRDEISVIIESENIPYREDSSNLSSKYARNKIRLEVVPRLKDLNPGLDETFEANARRFIQVEDFLNTEVGKLRERLFIQISKTQFEIRLEDLKSLSPKQLLLYELFKPFGFSEAVLTDFAQSWESQPGKLFKSQTYTLLLDRNRVLLEKKSEQHHSSEILFDLKGNDVVFGSTRLIFDIREIGSTMISPLKDKAFFDFSLLQFPLKLRQWNIGDYFFPFGMKGKKKVSDLFRELKIPLTEKKNIPILENANGDILWVVGYRSDNRYKVSSQTKKVITFEKLKHHDN